MNKIHNLIILDAKKIRPSYLPIQHYLSAPSSSSTSFSQSLQSFQEFVFNTGIHSFNQNIIDPTTISTHYSNTSVPYTLRLYNPLQYQEGIRSDFRLHQYCHYILVYHPIIPHHIYHQEITLLYPLLLSPILPPPFQTRKRCYASLLMQKMH